MTSNMTSMARTQWEANAPTDLDEARHRIIAAAAICVGHKGLSNTRIEDIAREAECSRATIYRYFSDREELILALILQESQFFAEQIEEHLARFEDPADALIEGVVYAIYMIKNDTGLTSYFSPGSFGIATSLAGTSSVVFEIVRQLVEPIFHQGQKNGRFRGDLLLSDICETLLRIVVSMLTFEGPKHRDKEGMQQFLRTFFLPSILA